MQFPMRNLVQGFPERYTYAAVCALAIVEIQKVVGIRLIGGIL
jgi:hypothetical protein